jgi:two-component system, NtrC family, sensor kinase
MAALPGDLDRLLHDLRGPLNAVTMHLEILKLAGPGEPGALASVEALRQEIGRLASLLPAAFDVVALECGDAAPMDLAGLVRSVVDEHGLGPVTVAPGRWPRVRGDARLLSLAVAHLIRNALAATTAAGPGRQPPTVSARPAGNGQVALVVRDWGSGLRTTNARALIRLAISPATGKPTVGLVTTERIARLHRGTLEFRNPAEGGAEVTLLLPGA